MIQAKRITKCFSGRRVLKDLNFTIKKNSVTGIVGPNACGKTTLIKCMLGQVFPTTGQIWIDGENSDGSEIFRKKIGYMPQTPRFPAHLSLRELLQMLESLQGKSSQSRQALVEHFNLQSIMDQPLEQLSGGTKQKVSAVIAFMFDPPIVLLDEPTVGLDPLAAVALKDLILDRAQHGTTIVLVTHLISEIEKLATEMIFLDEGEIAFEGAPRELLATTGATHLEKAIVKLFQNRTEKR